MSSINRKHQEDSCEDNAMEVKKGMLLNALAEPSGIDPGFTTSEQPIKPGDKVLNGQKNLKLKACGYKPFNHDNKKNDYDIFLWNFQINSL